MPFQPGQTGNPGGRPRSKGLAEYVRSKTRNGKDLVEFWLSVIEGRQPRATMQDKLKAAEQLADRGFGKPDISHKISGENGPIEIALRWSNGSDSQDG